MLKDEFGSRRPGNNGNWHDKLAGCKFADIGALVCPNSSLSSENEAHGYGIRPNVSFICWPVGVFMFVAMTFLGPR